MMASRTLALSLLALSLASGRNVHAQSNDEFEFTNGPVPELFQPGQHYPNRLEEEECRPIRLRIERNSRRYDTDLFMNQHPSVQFADADARVMSGRLLRRLNELADSFHADYGIWIFVTKAWTEYGDSEVTDPTSLHFEGRTVRVSVAIDLISPLLGLAVEVGFDWVLYAEQFYIRLSVIPDSCDISLDMVFMLDRSGSVGEENFESAIEFLQNVVSFFTIGSDSTQIGLVTYSTSAGIEFDLNDFQSYDEVFTALDSVVYTRGWTATALALTLTRFILDPNRQYGARPFAAGIPKVAVLLTDGRSNQLPITDRANALRDFGIQVFTVGIGDIYLPELRFIASDPDSEHVFLLNSFNDAQGFVDLLSFTTCDAPAIVEPGEDTTTEIEEDEFRFFQSRCAAFSQTIMIEQIDLVGKCALYASAMVQNPGPLDPLVNVVRNETQTSNSRSLLLNLPDSAQDNRFVYVSVLGKHSKNEFTIVIWDNIFNQDEYNIPIPEGDTAGQEIINLMDEIGMTDATFNFMIWSGNEGGLFSLDIVSGVLTTTGPLDTNVHSSFTLKIVAQNREHACHKARVIVTIEVAQENLQFNPLPQPETTEENSDVGTVVTQVTATMAGSGLLTYAIIDGNFDTTFDIDEQTGIITVAGPLDFETLARYTLTIQATNAATTNSATAIQVIDIEDVNEMPFFITECALTDSCMFTVPENEAANAAAGTVLADDPDDDAIPNGILTYSVNSDTFQVSSSGEISTTVPLDFETENEYSFQLIVQDGGALSIQTPIMVKVINLEENGPPVFGEPCTVVIVENAPVGSSVTTCKASDTDAQGRITDLNYAIVGGNEGNSFRFNPDRGPGVIVTAALLDHEERERYDLVITATDPEGLSGSTTVVITIDDVNEAPTCMPPTDPVQIMSDALPQGPGRIVTRFTAEDPDVGDGPPIFSLKSTVQDPSGISTTLTVQVADSMDQSLTSTCTLTIQFDKSCARQEYAIDSSTGELSARLLCSVMVVPPVIEAEEGDILVIVCPIVRNILVTYQWVHNGTAITDPPVRLSPSEERGILLRTGINFDFSGEYTCRAREQEGGGSFSLDSEPAIFNVLVPPEITMAPSDQSVPVGETAQFQCVASGIPDPTISWSRSISGQQVDILSSTDPRFTVMDDGSLRITDTETADQGDYICSASNTIKDTVKTATATAGLTVFSSQQQVVADVGEYFMPSLDHSCHEFNTTDFNSVLTDITSYIAMTTDQSSTDLCPPSACNPSPCENEGVCLTDTSAVGGYICRCVPQYTGRNCDQVVDPCTTTPCWNDGFCASTSDGHFICTCPDGYLGNRCQYTDVCTSSTPCESGQSCVETVVRSEGYVCVSVAGDGDGVSVVEGAAAELEGEVNSYIETTADLPDLPDDDESERKRRATSEDDLSDNGFVTVCEARFIPSSSASNTLLLVWACPDGVAAPGDDDEVAICDLLIDQRLVSSCTSHRGTVDLPPAPYLPPTRVNITFILVNPLTRRPLSATKVLKVLEETDALTRLQSTSYRAQHFSAVAVDDEDSTTSNNSGKIAGSVIGALISCVVIAVVVVIVICVVRHKANKKSVEMRGETDYLGEVHQNGNGTLNSVSFSNHYNQMPLDTEQSSKTFVFESPRREPVFDDLVYEAGFEASSSSYKPPDTHRRNSKRISTLERGMQVIKSRVSSLRRSESSSAENLLSTPQGEMEDSGDYDHLQTVRPHLTVPPPHPPKPSPHSYGSNAHDANLESSSEIYANMRHHQVGAMGNAGQRWQSYWETTTLLRTGMPTPDPTKN